MKLYKFNCKYYNLKCHYNSKYLDHIICELTF